jgi:hypothetical protein
MSFHIIPTSAVTIGLLEDSGITFENVGNSLRLSRKGANLLSVGDISTELEVLDIADNANSHGDGFTLCPHRRPTRNLTITVDPRAAVELVTAAVVTAHDAVATKQTVTPTILFKTIGNDYLHPRDDFICEDDNGYRVVFLEDDEIGEPFAVAINFSKRGIFPSTVPSAWIVAINEQELHYAYDQITGILYVANTIGAYVVQAAGLDMGDHAGTPNITTVIEERSVSGIAVRETATWTKLIERFMDNPSRETYMALVTSESCNAMYDAYKSVDRFRATPIKRSQTCSLKYSMQGKAKAMNYEDFAKEMRAVAIPSSPAHFLILICQLRGLMRSTTEGKIYIEA